MKYIIFFIGVFLCTSCSKETTIPIKSTTLIKQITPKFEIYRPNEKDPLQAQTQIKVIANEDETLIDIFSKFGIGERQIKLIEGNWSKTVIVRLHLGGLEGFSVSNGKTTIKRSDVSVKAYDKNGDLFDKKYLGGEKGYYEVKLPSSLFVDGTTEITINWIDFYR